MAAIGAIEWTRKDEPDEIEQWLQSADEITLNAKETRTVSLSDK
jgi:hypothetical protein